MSAIFVPTIGAKRTCTGETPSSRQPPLQMAELVARPPAPVHATRVQHAQPPPRWNDHPPSQPKAAPITDLVLALRTLFQLLAKGRDTIPHQTDAANQGHAIRWSKPVPSSRNELIQIHLVRYAKSVGETRYLYIEKQINVSRRGKRSQQIGLQQCSPKPTSQMCSRSRIRQMTDDVHPATMRGSGGHSACLVC
jgi:hypothetical protein